MTQTYRILKTLGWGLTWALILPIAWANAWHKKTEVTFPESVEIPGGAVLSPGKYVFKLADSTSNRHIVQIFNDREDHIYATILAIPNYRLDPPDKTLMTFYEMPGGRPQALRSWFYPGDNFGQQFAYPKTRADQIARATRQNVPVTPEESGPELQARASSGKEPSDASSQAPSKAAAEPQVKASAEEAAKDPTASSTPQKLPQTASNLPWTGLLGLLALGTAGMIRVLGKKVG